MIPKCYKGHKIDVFFHKESRESLHGAIRRGDLASVEATLSAEGGRTLARGKSSFGRTALHVAVLAQHEEIVAFLADKFPELLRFGDNVSRANDLSFFYEFLSVLKKTNQRRLSYKTYQPVFYSRRAYCCLYLPFVNNNKIIINIKKTLSSKRH